MHEPSLGGFKDFVKSVGGVIFLGKPFAEKFVQTKALWHTERHELDANSTRKL